MQCGGIRSSDVSRPTVIITTGTKGGCSSVDGPGEKGESLVSMQAGVPSGWVHYSISSITPCLYHRLPCPRIGRREESKRIAGARPDS